MVIVYESKTGYTKKYAQMLADKTNLDIFHVAEISKISKDEEIIFLGWIKVGKIQGLNKLKNYNVKIVCGSGTAQTAEPDTETIIARNKIKGISFFYLRGGCLPLKDIKGMDRLLLSFFVKLLKNQKEKDEKTLEAIHIIENGFDGVREANLGPVLDFISKRAKE